MLDKQLILPPRNDQEQNETFVCREPLVIIGSNGSGKSKLGFWIEQNQLNPEKVHRISAQRSLDFSEYIQLKGLEQAENEFRFGTADPIRSYGQILPAKLESRWRNGGRPVLSITPILNDYEQVLSLLFAKKAQRDSRLGKRVREMEREGKNELPEMPDSPDEILLHIWNDLLPHRQLVIEDGKITVSLSDDNTYHGREMSDGERVALYLMAQCLCVPPDSIVIIDEPEIHLHKSLMSKLWSKIEEAQPNCLFIYITHDIDFAASRVGSKKIWLKSYDGRQWHWDEVPEAEDLPEPVLLEILGSRKKVLFVEGDKGSLDYKIYQAIYPDCLIMPSGGCEKVIESTKAMRGNPALHHVDAFGIVDMDYRSEDEIKALKKYGIFPLNVAEVENILCVPELLNVVASRLELNYKAVYQEVSDFVINEISKNLEDQVSKRSASEIEFKLNMFDAKAKGEDALSKALKSLTDSIDVNKIYNNNLNLYKNITDNMDYGKALLFYNNKGLSKMISRFFHFNTGEYGKYIVRLLSTEHKDAIISGLKKYAPNIPDR
ncbi:MAG TPA: ABC transporter ATP-binding protein [Cyanobacteria bacterium UBA11149]|nr:ABC transporter ATP-binding protein [Cyanobacteria bacterium UBA11367]HBE57742.1 ABC transporter ATP-binding protein [Cyanobacteria bacterium UBA11366]HBK62024.1 ABC transporter ATP-binding protein [Cyanobacteria bacterium UBA11166]HBR77000.1 ABC transporter ATP-binding protein [Cyanobacteria bacterium UBA11159]HBS67606.1 ABC transporter ATP-binding protein [Cyanobacteria bacterium UBA11153]HBW87871.1 ABC transporter ATP-binding protein [Cyanobacteria bacterium UBA11149]HCA96920.1 ABC tran